MRESLLRKVDNINDVVRYVHCQNELNPLGSLAVITKDRHGEIRVQFISRAHNVTVECPDKEWPWTTSLSVCAYKNHIMIVNKIADGLSTLSRYDYNGQCLQDGDVGFSSPFSNAICLADLSGSFFVVGNEPLTLLLFMFDPKKERYVLVNIICKEDLGLGCDFELRCTGISSSIRQKGDDVITTLCMALSDRNGNTFLCVVNVNPLLFKPIPFQCVHKAVEQVIHKNGIDHFNPK